MSDVIDYIFMRLTLFVVLLLLSVPFYLVIGRIIHEEGRDFAKDKKILKVVVGLVVVIFLIWTPFWWGFYNRNAGPWEGIVRGKAIQRCGAENLFGSTGTCHIIDIETESGEIQSETVNAGAFEKLRIGDRVGKKAGEFDLYVIP